jgi:hypothetical protein
VGSLIGAATSRAPQPPETVPTAVVGTAKAEPNYSAAKEYWTAVLILTTVALPIYAISQGGDEPLEWAFAAAIFLPAIQIIASVIVAVRTSVSKRPGRDERMRHLGSITLRAFLGGLFGILAMVVVFQFM